MPVTMMIGYPRDANFNTEYYPQHHFPMANPLWKPFGAEVSRVMVPLDPRSPYAMLIEIEWPNMEAFQRAQAETPAEMSQKLRDDMKNFTDEDPVIWFMENKVNGS